MVRHDCPDCDRGQPALLVVDGDGEAYICVGCAGPVHAENVSTPESSLTPRDKSALDLEVDEE